MKITPSWYGLGGRDYTLGVSWKNTKTAIPFFGAYYISHHPLNSDPTLAMKRLQKLRSIGSLCVIGLVIFPIIDCIASLFCPIKKSPPAKPDPSTSTPPPKTSSTSTPPPKTSSTATTSTTHKEKKSTRSAGMVELEKCIRRSFRKKVDTYDLDPKIAWEFTDFLKKAPKTFVDSKKRPVTITKVQTTPTNLGDYHQFSFKRNGGISVITLLENRTTNGRNRIWINQSPPSLIQAEKSTNDAVFTKIDQVVEHFFTKISPIQVDTAIARQLMLLDKKPIVSKKATIKPVLNNSCDYTPVQDRMEVHHIFEIEWMDKRSLWDTPITSRIVRLKLKRSLQDSQHLISFQFMKNWPNPLKEEQASQSSTSTTSSDSQSNQTAPLNK